MQCALPNGRVVLIRLLALPAGALVVLGLAGGCARTGRAERVVFDRGYAALEAGRYAQAVKDFTRYLRLDPDSPQRGEVYYYRGEALVRLNRPQDARADFHRAIGAGAPEPIDQFAQVALGNLYYESGDDVEAVKHYAVVLRDPHDAVPVPLLLLRTGVALERLGQWEKGQRYLRHLVRTYPSSPAARQAMQYVRADGFRVQTGAFASQTSAATQARRVRQAGFSPRLARVNRSGRTLTAVQVGRARTYAEAAALAGRLRAAGFDTLIVP